MICKILLQWDDKAFIRIRIETNVDLRKNAIYLKGDHVNIIHRKNIKSKLIFYKDTRKTRSGRRVLRVPGFPQIQQSPPPTQNHYSIFTKNFTNNISQPKGVGHHWQDDAIISTTGCGTSLTGWCLYSSFQQMYSKLNTKFFQVPETYFGWKML